MLGLMLGVMYLEFHGLITHSHMRTMVELFQGKQTYLNVVQKGNIALLG